MFVEVTGKKLAGDVSASPSLIELMVLFKVKILNKGTIGISYVPTIASCKNC